LTTICFTDIVDSTAIAQTMGDEEWVSALRDHDELARSIVAEHQGRLVKRTGDGVLATFSTPTAAISAAGSLGRAVTRLGLDIRAGVHTGEVDLADDGDVNGIAVHIAARIAALASPGEVLVSNTVKDLVAGPGITFEDRGIHALKGVPDDWKLYAVDHP
jgi:class 3 adenylate cyclase